MRRLSLVLSSIVIVGLLSLPAAVWAGNASVSVGPNVNLTRAPGNQAVGAIAIDPSDVNRVFVVSQDETGGLASARSSDGGLTWTRAKIAPGGGLPIACCNPSVSWDAYGNLFITYLGAPPFFYVVLAVSTDGGATFSGATPLGVNADQPTVTTGPAPDGGGSVWVTFNRGAIYATGAPVSGPGAVGSFLPALLVPSPPSVNYGDIAIGPAGEVMVTYGPAFGIDGVYTSLKADGLGPGLFADYVLASPTNMGGFIPLPAQPSWGVDPEAGLAWDRSGGPHTGRAYLVYTDRPSIDSSDTDIFVRRSDDAGATWSAPVRVNDDAGASSQFLPRIALDQSTGAVAVTWYDTREDPDNVAARFHGAVSVDGGLTFGPNFAVAAAASREAGADPPPPPYHDIDFGDYTGSAFVSGVLMPVWADNSNATGDNPDGTLHRLDIYTAAVRVTIADTTPPTLTVPSEPTANATSPAGAAVTWTLQVSDPDDPPAALTSSCTPVSGSTFAIGITTVHCQASDPAGNTATATFTVHVKGADEQLADLLAGADGVGPGASLQQRLTEVARLYDGGRSAAAANILDAFVNAVAAQSGKSLTPEMAAELTAAALRIRALVSP
ncbi:MAG TPA: HYR domain-containing protein [Methylomirabilota bacterium]|nr:HYR domain-containing protein [Methylomirabilota bacterium]